MNGSWAKKKQHYWLHGKVRNAVAAALAVEPKLEWLENMQTCCPVGCKSGLCRHQFHIWLSKMKRTPSQCAGSTSRTLDDLEICVENFGPILEATVELRPLTVFVGPGNTGKSCLAMLIYALHRSFSDYSESWRSSQPSLYHMFKSFGLGGRIDPKIQAIAEEMAEWHSVAVDGQRKESGDTPTLPIQALEKCFASRQDAIAHEICRCFGVESIASLIHRNAAKSHVRLKRRGTHETQACTSTLTFNPESCELAVSIPQGIVPSSVTDEEKLFRQFLKKGKEQARAKILVDWLILNLQVDEATPHIVGALHQPAFYLPAARTGVLKALSAVVSAQIGHAPMAGGLRPTAQTPMLSGVYADFLKQLIEIADNRRRRPATGMPDLSSKIEKGILDGNVRVDGAEATNCLQFSYIPRGWKKRSRSLLNASSMVSDLAPVVLYIRHLVSPGNVLIVEEPEAHLHPAMQIEFTRLLAELVLSGVRLIVTTHSEWLLEELANIVQRSKLPKVNGQSAEDRPALDPKQVGVWQFAKRRRPKGSFVREIRIDESGLYPSDFDDVATALHNEWASIASRVEGKRE